MRYSWDYAQFQRRHAHCDKHRTFSTEFSIGTYQEFIAVFNGRGGDGADLPWYMSKLTYLCLTCFGCGWIPHYRFVTQTDNVDFTFKKFIPY
jgi:hypothetical protein